MPGDGVWVSWQRPGGDKVDEVMMVVQRAGER
jgi:hypothetical protein